MQGLANLLSLINPLPKEYIRTANSLGRVIAAPVASPIALPGFDIAIADGYAVSGATPQTVPVLLKVTGESSSAKPFKGALESGCAVKMYAGGRVPTGTEAVVTNAVLSEDKQVITVDHAPLGGQNISPAGVDIEMHENIFNVGETMNARMVGLASTAHLFWLPVVRKPRVAVLAVGSELEMPGGTGDGNRVTASSLYTFSANIINAGGEPVILGIVSDNAAEIKEKVKEARGCDLLFTTGATSLAAGNLMQVVLKEICENYKILSVEINRNDCMIFGTYGDMAVCSVPGNPISAQIYSTLFVKPIINKLVGMPPLKKQYAILGRDLDGPDNTMAYLHSSLYVDNLGKYIVTPVSAQDGFLISALAKSDCLLVVDKAKQYKKGDLVEIVRF